MTRRIGIAALFAIAAVAGVVAMSSGNPPGDAAKVSAGAFLGRYAAPEGRVVRWDQGGDTVSEGQSYALLLAQIADDRQTFANVWRWTRVHLRRKDGLLSYRATADRVADPMPATDADLVTAWALMRASGPGSRRYHADGRRLAAAVLANETANDKRTLLTAGPWATGNPATVNPSYLAFPAIEALGHRWRGVRATSLALVRNVTAGGRLLPPDWVRVDGTTARATPSPDGRVPDVRYGLDAQRTVVWMAASCDSRARRMAAGWWRMLSNPARSGAIALGQRGDVRIPTRHPLPLVAAAAAADAAGKTADRDRLLAEADAQNAAQPTYYGAAWVALGRALLTTHSLGRCAGNGVRS